MTEPSLVHAWRLGYSYGRAEAEKECGHCRPGLEPGNLLHLDDWRDTSVSRISRPARLPQP
jgi:hypothetical protein